MAAMTQAQARNAAVWTKTLLPTINEGQLAELARIFEPYTPDVVTATVRKYIDGRRKNPEFLADLSPTFIDLPTIVAMLRATEPKTGGEALRQAIAAEVEKKRKADVECLARLREEDRRIGEELNALPLCTFIQIKAAAMYSLPPIIRKWIGSFSRTLAARMYTILHS